MGEIVAWLMSVMERAGKPGAILSILFGLALIPAGIYLFLYGAGPGYYWPIMLGLSGLGVPFILLGLGPLVGNQARLSSAMEGGATPVRASRAQARSALEAMQPPFGSCSDCGQVTQIDRDPDRCPECFSIPGWVHTMDESGRDRVLSNLG